MTKILTYIGMRMNGDKIAKAFIDDKGKEYFWSKMKYITIGNKYKAKKNGKNLSMSTVPEQAKGSVTDEDLLSKWHLEDEAAREFQKRKSAYNRSLKFSLKDKTLEDLKRELEKVDSRTKSKVADRVSMYLIFGHE